MIHNTNAFCDGCDQNCEYGYAKDSITGALYPALGCHVMKDYWVSRSEHEVINADTIKTPEQAIEVARIIANRCNHNFRNRRVK